MWMPIIKRMVNSGNLHMEYYADVKKKMNEI